MMSFARRILCRDWAEVGVGAAAGRLPLAHNFELMQISLLNVDLVEELVVSRCVAPGQHDKPRRRRCHTSRSTEGSGACSCKFVKE